MKVGDTVRLSKQARAAYTLNGPAGNDVVGRVIRCFPKSQAACVKWAGIKGEHWMLKIALDVVARQEAKRGESPE